MKKPLLPWETNALILNHPCSATDLMKFTHPGSHERYGFLLNFVLRLNFKRLVIDPRNFCGGLACGGGDCYVFACVCVVWCGGIEWEWWTGSVEAWSFNYLWIDCHGDDLRRRTYLRRSYESSGYYCFCCCSAISMETGPLLLPPLFFSPKFCVNLPYYPFTFSFFIFYFLFLCFLQIFSIL